MNNKKILSQEFAQALLKEYGSPLYVYDKATLVSSASTMAHFLDGTEINYKCHYAVKSNGNPYLLRLMKDCGLFFDSMSLGELELVNLAGIDSNEILYVCNNVSSSEMSMVNKKNILMVLDSISQVETFGKTNPNSKIMIRINPGATGIGHCDKVITSGDKTKFGINPESFDEVKEVAKKYNLQIIGIHQDLGSCFLNDKISNFIDGIKTGLELAKQFEGLEIIDLGGGFGIPYKPDEEHLSFELLKKQLVPVLKEFISKYGNVEFKFEPGRFVVAESGILLGTVNSIKNNGDICFVGTDIGMANLVRPSMYDAYHHIETIPSNKNSKEITATIVGNVCESGDILGKDRLIKSPTVGDAIIVYDAGAYGTSMSSNYTGRTTPAEVLIDQDGNVIKIKEAQTTKDLLRLYPTNLY